MKAVYCYLGTWILLGTHTLITDACREDCNKTTVLESTALVTTHSKSLLKTHPTTPGTTLLKTHHMLLTTHSTTVPENHRLQCTETEAHYIGCLNGGTCLASVIDDIRFISCQCPNMYAGHRCQTIDVRIILAREERDKVKTPYLVLGIALPVLLLIMLLSYAVYKSAHKENTKEEENVSFSVHIAEQTS